MENRSRLTCQYRKYDGELCKRNVSEGEDKCWQHASSWRHKWKSLTRNQTIAFMGLVVSVLIGIGGLVATAWSVVHPAPTKEEIAKEVVRNLPPPKRKAEKEPQGNLSTEAKPTIEGHRHPESPESTPNSLERPNIYVGSDIIVEVGPSPEPNFAFETRFILTNRNSKEILDARYICATQKVDMNAKLPGLIVKLAPAPRLSTGPIGTVPSEDKHSIYCDYVADLWANDLERPELNLWIYYKYNEKDMKRGFKFLAIPSQDGKHTFIWLPRGAAEEIQP
jgi:hypothetical protein